MKTNNVEDFEEYLKEIHGEQYRGIDDEMPDDYQNWRSDLTDEETEHYKKEWITTVKNEK